MISEGLKSDHAPATLSIPTYTVRNRYCTAPCDNLTRQPGVQDKPYKDITFTSWLALTQRYDVVGFHIQNHTRITFTSWLAPGQRYDVVGFHISSCSVLLDSATVEYHLSERPEYHDISNPCHAVVTWPENQWCKSK